MGISNNRGILKDVPLSNDFMFGQVFSKNRNCKGLLDRILGKDVGKIKISRSQDHIEVNAISKGIRLDIRVLNDKGEVFDIEMQKKNVHLGLRSRYYQSIMTVKSLTKGKSYRDLTDLYIIFICTKDPFGKKRIIYTFGDEICIEDQSVRLKTKIHKIYLYTGGTVGDIDEELREVLRFIENSTETEANNAKSSFVKSLYKDIQEVKYDPKKEEEYMSLYMMLEDANEEGEERGERRGIEKGRIEGRAEGKIEGIKEGEEKRTNLILKALEMLKQGFSKEEIERETHLSGDVLDKLFSAV